MPLVLKPNNDLLKGDDIMIAELRQKAQVTIPKEIIVKLGLSEGDKLDIFETFHDFLYDSCIIQTRFPIGSNYSSNCNVFRNFIHDLTHFLHLPMILFLQCWRVKYV